MNCLVESVYDNHYLVESVYLYYHYLVESVYDDHYLVESVDERLKAGKVSDKLEDPHHPHNSHLSNHIEDCYHDVCMFY